MSDAFIIVLDRATAAEREAVQEIVSTHAKSWWHRFDNAWVVDGYTAEYWQTLIRPVLPFGRSAVLVLRLPKSLDERQARYFGPEPGNRMQWFEESFLRAAIEGGDGPPALSD